MIIYTAIHRASGKRYVGLTERSLDARREDHESEGRRDPGCYFHHALRKHGAGAFDWRVLDRVDSKPLLLIRERFWIALYKSNVKGYGYNGTEGGESPKLNAQSRAKLSASCKGRTAHNKGKPMHPNTAAALRATWGHRKGTPAWNKGIPHTAATRAKMSAAKKR